MTKTMMMMIGTIPRNVDECQHRKRSSFTRHKGPCLRSSIDNGKNEGLCKWLSYFQRRRPVLMIHVEIYIVKSQMYKYPVNPIRLMLPYAQVSPPLLECVGTGAQAKQKEDTLEQMMDASELVKIPLNE